MVLVLHLIGLLVDSILRLLPVLAVRSHVLSYKESSLRAVSLAGKTPLRASRSQNWLRLALLVSRIKSRHPMSCRGSVTSCLSL